MVKVCQATKNSPRQ